MSAPERIWAFDYDLQDDDGTWKNWQCWCEDSPAPLKATEYIRADLALAAPKVKALVEALRWYASQEAWTIDQVEGPHGDYGAKARAALAALEGGDG